MKKINFKQPKYILPLVALPFVLFIAYSGNKFIGASEPQQVQVRKELSTDLGQVSDSIKNKDDAYLDFFSKDSDGRTMVGAIGEEQDSLQNFQDNLSMEQKRHIDSLAFMKERERLDALSNRVSGQQSYYDAQNSRQEQNRRREEDEYERSMKMIELLQGGSNSSISHKESAETENNKAKTLSEKQDDPVQMMRKQMLFLDSLERARDPEIQAQAEAGQLLKKQREKMEDFLNSTLKVSKAGKNPAFHSIYKEQETSFIKAVIDENITGYLGSRIRIRILEDIYAGKTKIDKGTVLYAQLSGFTLQRADLSIVSVMYKGKLLPVNLSVYDLDGMKGLYVPSSVFREMTRTLGENSLQGTGMSGSNSDFFTTTLTSFFQSTSKTISDLIRKNKVKVKYNSFLYLIDEQSLKEER